MPIDRETSEFSENSYDEAELEELEPNQARSFCKIVEKQGASRVKITKLKEH